MEGPPGHTREVWKLHVPLPSLQLKEEFGKFSGMPFFGLQEAPQSVFDY